MGYWWTLMSDLTNDMNTVAAVTEGHERIYMILQNFSYSGASWDDYPAMGEQYLEMVKIDLAAILQCVEVRLQETYSTDDPIDFG
jgi:hypothetical protein